MLSPIRPVTPPRPVAPAPAEPAAPVAATPVAAAPMAAAPPPAASAPAEPYIERGTNRRLPWETGNAPATGSPEPAAPPPPRPAATTHTVWTNAASGTDGGSRDSGPES